MSAPTPSRANSSTDRPRTAVLVDGCRIPFQRAGTGYLELRSYDLARMALKGLLVRSAVDPAAVDRVILGTVIQNVETSNVAREAALAAGIPAAVPAHTVTMACISSNLAITEAADLIAAGHGDVVLAGGTESLSDVPLRFSKSFRKRLYSLRKSSSARDVLELFKGLRPSDVVPHTPSIAEFSTGKTMGESADRLAAAYGVSREDQDGYALRSHQRAARARDAGHLAAETVPAAAPPRFEAVERDNTIRDDTRPEKLAQLPAAFVQPFGTITAGNSSPITDGASAVLLATPDKARELGLKPRAALRHYTYVAQEPGEELLLGPAYAIPRVLDSAGLTVGDVQVWELHEAFAGQVLAVLAALTSRDFAEHRLGRGKPVGEIPMERLNTWGGSLSLVHPFGATGARLVTTAVHRLEVEDARFALVAACAAGGQGHALLLERWEDGHES